ncbi:MAG: hypothetical protein EA377_01320 [Phycisphaerales bacterium]|nr:MAG: hypothetical protein EA377_01320 [Phycisphaerales bacterium]
MFHTIRMQDRLNRCHFINDGFGDLAAVVPMALLFITLAMFSVGCATTVPIEEAMGELRDPNNSPGRQVAAMNALDTTPEDEAYREQLHRLMYVPGYTVAVREEAFKRLEAIDPEGLKRTIRQRYPRLNMPGWSQRLSELIADRGWVELTPALISRWGRENPLIRDESDRIEYQTLVKLHGQEAIADLLFDTFLTARSVAEQGLRVRCWDLLHRLGHRDRLIELITEAELPEDDAMLIDLRAGAVELGIVPHNREEILWLRKLREPARADFWSEARSAMAQLSAERRRELELRDLAIVVAAARHAPEMLTMSTQELDRRLTAYLDTQRHHHPTDDFDNIRGGRRDLLRDHRDRLKWGDYVAMHMAIKAFQVPQMVEHLFDFAERDRQDDTTEYGGVIDLDEQGRFELLEFIPRIRQHAQKFIASQEMLDAAYTALFHFHNHAQRYNNADYAGPGFGDLNYADNLRANCLVFTFINENTINMDYYRHGRVVVDLGEIRR